MTNKNITNYYIEAFDVDFNKRLRISALGRYLIDAAGKHADKLGFGIDYLFSKQMSWVLNRLKFEIYKYPVYKQTIKIETWVHSVEGIFSERKFLIRNESDGILAEASSSWVVINLATRRPVFINEVITNNEMIYQHPLSKIIAPEKLKPNVTENDFSETITVNYSDIDINKHLYSLRYIDLALNQFEPEFFQAHVLKSLDINYSSELKWKEKINIYEQLTDKVSIIEFKKENDKKSSAIIRILWD